MKKEIILKILKVFTTVFVIGIIIYCSTMLFLSGGLIGTFLMRRNHWSVESCEQVFLESNKEIQNPNRGFYTMIAFIVREDVQKYYYHKQLAEGTYYDLNALSMIQINLCRYKEGTISDEGLMKIKSLFNALEMKDKQYIIRFLYDWDGRATETEPKDVQIILEHMEQLEDILEEYKHIIFAFQGIFVGNHAEMHSSNHLSDESTSLLIQKLMDITPEETFLSVRTPLFWRKLTGYTGQENLRFSELSKRLGLFNDGMMGTDLDYGTYGIHSKTEVGPYGQWIVEEEMAFQEELCKYVPNGGEVIVENPVNDFENAVKRMRTMHVTYLNQAYDQNVFNKWENSTVTEPGVFFGMDGLNYVRRMLGYRHLIDTVSLSYNFWPDELDVAINIKNVGFAPIYKEPEKYMTVKNKETGVIQTYPVAADLRSLSGGNDTDQILTITKTLPLAGFEPGEYEVYFSMKDTDSGWYLELANEQEMQEYGYLVGAFSVGEIKNPFTGEPLNMGEMLDTFLGKVEAVYEQGNFGRR